MSPMIFEDLTEEYLNYHNTLDSPRLRPISLPMSGHDKSLNGMINLHNATISFPHSDAFVQYAESAYLPQMSAQCALPAPYPEGEFEYCSDSEFGYPSEFNTKAVVPFDMTHQANTVVSKNVEVQPVSRKRKASASPEYVPAQPTKRVASAQVHVQDPEGDYYDLNQDSPYSPYVRVPALQTVSNSPRPSHHYSTSNASQISLAAPSPHTPGFSPSFETVKTEQSPCAPMTPIPRPASATTPCHAPLPTLVRTSTMPQQGSPNLSVGAGPPLGGHTHTFNPYAMYPQHKASLRLNGDLDAVGHKWSEEELQASRKLVVFTRSQSGSVIDAEFKIVAQDEWQRGDITVNCIWWKERKEAFVTSVDTIALLEQLVAVRFTVEEKNRIRRNLEGFRPLTVSKAKSDSEDFFKIIMGFPNPKPRNIEKDVKVFPWKILSGALKKIISKYSASYSSTASTLMTPAPSVYASTEHSGDYQLAPSPVHDIVTSSIPTCTLPATVFEPHVISGRMSAPVPSAVQGLSLQVPNMSPSYPMQHPYGYGVMPMAPYPMYGAQHAMTAPVQRPYQAWDFDVFAASNGLVHAPQPDSAPVSAYPRGPNETAEFMVPPAYQHYQN